MIWCERCLTETDEERAQRGECSCSSELVELAGPAREHVSSPEAYGDALRVAEFSLRMLQSDRALLPTEWLSQPAKFTAAYDYMRPFMARDIQEAREELRRKAQK